MRLDKDFQVMHKATRAQDLLIQSMTLMDQQVQQRVTEKIKTRSTGFGGDQTKTTSNNNGEEHVLMPTQTPGVNKTKKTAGLLAFTNTREAKQSEVESFLLNQLGERFKHAKLLEVSDGSYLITMDVRLPVFGKALSIEKRDMKSILRDRAGYLLKRDAQKYTTSQRNRVGLDEKQESKGPQVADSEAFSLGEAAKSIVYDKKLLQGATTKVPMPQLTQMIGPIPSQQRKMVGDHYLAGGNLDSESDIHALQALSGIPSTGFHANNHFDIGT